MAAARPRVLAALTRTFRNIDLAEDAFQEASLRALTSWHRLGVPRDPTAWMIRAGRNLTIDRLRREGRETLLPEELETTDPEHRLVESMDRGEMRDDVLRLLFLCCHEELEVQDQLALALKIVAGFSVEKIARAFVIKPTAMGQRITRAKKKARATIIRLETPSRFQRSHRLGAVGTMVYLLFSEGYNAAGGDTQLRFEVAEEALRLARLLLELFPSQPELMGLLALCLLQHSRRHARLDTAGDVVLLEDQDRGLWDQEMIAEGRVLVEKALRKRSAGPFQVQAAIAAVHCAARTSDDTDWFEIAALYAALERIQPTPVVTLNRAVAVSKTHGVDPALTLLEPLAKPLAHYLYYHSTRAALLEEAGRHCEAVASYQHAVSLRPTAPEKTYLLAKIETLTDSSGDSD